MSFSTDALRSFVEARRVTYFTGWGEADKIDTQQAPHNFTALYAAPPSHATSPSSPNSSSSSSARQKPTHPDLITRYNLSARVAAAQASNTPAPTGDEEIQTKEKQREKGGWSGSKVDRQALLRQRREEMILAARRKMEERGVKGTKVKGKGRA